jgi:hypothetical protein
MSTKLFRAILAMDAYNRGYLPRISGLDNSPNYGITVPELRNYGASLLNTLNYLAAWARAFGV